MTMRQTKTITMVEELAKEHLARVEELVKQHNLPITEAGMYLTESGLAAPLIEEEDGD
jgi:predicted transcriptional regulator